MIAPAPRKPIPVTTCAAMRVGSKTSPRAFEKCQSVHAKAETSVNSAAPTETSMCVRSPASRSRSSRSKPIAPPRNAASTTRRRTSAQPSSGNRRLHRVSLRVHDPLDSGGGKIEHLVELLAREALSFGGRLHLDQASVAAHHDVDVHLRPRILRVIEVEQSVPVDDAHRDCRDGGGQRPAEAES